MLLVQLALTVSYLTAQTDYNKVPDVTNIILINDVYIYPNAVDSFGLGDILIEGGLIKQIAKQIDLPYNAKLIKGDSTYAYPAFIDGLSHNAIPTPKRRQERPKVDFRGFPPNDVAGIQAEREAIDFVKVDEKSIENLRKNGFAIVHVVPRGRMLPGQGCIISLKGDNVEEMLLRNNNSLFFQLSGAPGVYPSTIIAVMAKWRELYKNAESYQKNQFNYNLSPVGQARPKNDVCLQAIVPATNGKMTVYAKANSAKDVYRMMALQKELGYKMILADVKQADPAIPMLKENKIGIILSMELPKEDKKKEDKKKNDEDAKEEKVQDEQTKALIERRDKSLKEYVSQASRLEKEGIPFAFSLLSGDASDVKSNLNRMIEEGLSKEEAMRSLTINAAKILGIDNITGSIEEGKLANLFLSTKPYLDKESSIKFMVVEGELKEYEIKKKKKSKSGETNKLLLGDWTYSVVVMGEENTGVFKVRESEGSLDIELIDDSDMNRTQKCEEISFEDGVLSMALTINADSNLIPISLVLDMEEDNYSGTAVVGDFGSFPIEGKKISTPEK